MISKEKFKELKYGDVILANSRDCTNTKIPHICIIISDGTVEHISSKESRSIKFAICLSGTPSPYSHEEIQTNNLPEEIKNYYSTLTNTREMSLLRYCEPITILRNNIKNIFSCNFEPEINNVICNLLCSDSYLFHNMVRNGDRYENHFIQMGEVCPCFNFNHASANTVKLCPECDFFTECEYPEDKEVSKIVDEINECKAQMNIHGCDEITSITLVGDNQQNIEIINYRDKVDELEVLLIERIREIEN